MWCKVVATKSVGPKGQVVIPKQIRDAIGLKPSVEVAFELRDDEIVIKKPKIEGSYTEYYTSTLCAKTEKTSQHKRDNSFQGQPAAWSTLTQTFSYIQ